MERSQDRNSRLEPEAEVQRTAAHWLLSGSRPGPSQTLRPRVGTSHSGVDPPPSISKVEKCPQICPQASLMKAVLQLRLPLLRCIKLTARLSHHTTQSSLPYPLGERLHHMPHTIAVSRKRDLEEPLLRPYQLSKLRMVKSII